MYDPEMRKDCPMRGTLGNCSPVGGFCVNAVSDEICEAVHNAYQHGYGHAIAMLKEQEPVKPTWSQGKAYCGNCGQRLPRKCAGIERRYCSFCGRKVKWDE